MREKCCLCGQPIVEGEAVHGAYFDERARHYDCHVQRYGEPMNYAKKFRDEAEALDARMRVCIKELRRVLKGVQRDR